MNARAMCLAVALMSATWANQPLPSGAGRSIVTKVPSGDTVVISGVGVVRLLGVQSADGRALQFGTPAAPSLNPTPVDGRRRRRLSAARTSSSESSPLATSFRS